MKDKNERLDDLQNGYMLFQNPKQFCFGIDAVLLAWFAKAKSGERVLDMGTGTGIVPILMKARYPKGYFTGLEIQEESAELARRSVAYNKLEQDIDIVTGDIKEAGAVFGGASFDVVTTNPPYMIGSHGLTGENSAKTIARHETLCTLDDIIAQAAKVLVPKGRFYMVHRPFRLAEIMSVMVKYKIEPKRMRLVQPYADKEPNLVLIEGLRGGKSRIEVERPLIVYEKTGVYTDEILDIYGRNHEGKIMSGKLYLCATPIGNLEDMTFRVVRTLKEVDLIAAEDTRNSIKLLNHFEIKTPMTSYHEYNKIDKGHYLVEQLLEGKNIALVTDAGTPGISDPGFLVVRECVRNGIEVQCLPGATAFVPALVASGLPNEKFCFEGFLPPEERTADTTEDIGGRTPHDGVL